MRNWETLLRNWEILLRNCKILLSNCFPQIIFVDDFIPQNLWKASFQWIFYIFLLVDDITLKLSNCYSSKKTSKSKKRQEILTINLSWQMQLFSLFLPISHGLEKSQLFIFYDQSLRPKSFTSCNEGYNQNGCWQWHNNEIWGGEKKIQFSWCNCLLGT